VKEKEPKGQKPGKQAGSRGGKKKKETINPLDVDPVVLESSKDETSASS
jgi:hypothetical protein